MSAACGVFLRSSSVPYADSELGADGKVERVVRCACGAAESVTRVHPATHCGYSCVRCNSEDEADGYVLSADVVRYAGTPDERLFSVRAFRQHDGRYGWTGCGSSCGASTLQGAFIEALAVAAGASYNAARAAGKAVVR